MSVRPIVQYNDPRLRQRSSTVEIFDSDLRTLVSDMFETMAAAGGLGLAAVQVGVMERVIVVHANNAGSLFREALINPRILSSDSTETEEEEGCLSIPGAKCLVKRSSHIVVASHTVTGEGVLILDRVSRLRRERALARFHKLKKSQ